MTRPVVSDSAEHFNALLGPLNAQDSDDNGWAGLALAAGAAAMLQGLDVISQDTATHVAWGVILDPDACPAGWLPWLAALYGVQLPAGASVQAMRDQIRDLPAQRRGNPDTMIAAVKQVLTGSRAVRLLERVDGDAYKETVVTRTAETPDTAAVIAAAVSQKPGGIVLNAVVSDFALIADWTRRVDATTAAVDSLMIGDVT